MQRVNRWVVELSNGERFTEGQAPFHVIAGKPKPWARLVEYCKERKLAMNSLSMDCNGHIVHLFQAIRYPKFKKYMEARKPIGFRFFQQVGIEEATPNDWYSIIEATYDGFSVQVWANDATGESWCVVQ